MHFGEVPFLPVSPSSPDTFRDRRVNPTTWCNFPAIRNPRCFFRCPFPFLSFFFFLFFFFFCISDTQHATRDIYPFREASPLPVSLSLSVSYHSLFVYHAESYYALLSARPGRGPNNAIGRLTLFNARAHANRIHAGHASVRECVRA